MTITHLTAAQGADKLSNFAPTPIRIRLHGKTHTAPTAEHAFQAAKMARAEDAEAIIAAPTPAAAKRMGKSRKTPIHPQWDQIREAIMAEIIRAKMAQNPDAAEQLEATGDQEIQEGNTWNDTYWGICRGKGKNRLGHILMAERAARRQ